MYCKKITEDKIQLKQARNIFNALTRNENSIYYDADRIIKTLVKKKRQKNNQQEIYFNGKKQEINIAAYVSFLQKNIATYIDLSSTLYSFKGPFELLHGDITNIKFLAKSAADPKYRFLFLDLFTSEMYIYLMKNRSLWWPRAAIAKNYYHRK